MRKEETLEPDVIICLWGEQAAVSVGAFVLRGERLDHEEPQKGKEEEEALTFVTYFQHFSWMYFFCISGHFKKKEINID